MTLLCSCGAPWIGAECRRARLVLAHPDRPPAHPHAEHYPAPAYPGPAGRLATIRRHRRATVSAMLVATLLPIGVIIVTAEVAGMLDGALFVAWVIFGFTAILASTILWAVCLLGAQRWWRSGC